MTTSDKEFEDRVDEILNGYAESASDEERESWVEAMICDLFYVEILMRRLIKIDKERR